MGHGPTNRLRRWRHAITATAASARDRLAARSRVVSRALRVQHRFGEVRGGPLSASITLASFLALFPIAVLGVAVLGATVADPHEAARTVVHQLGLRGNAGRTIEETVTTARATRRAASVIGFVGLVWAALGVVGALGTAYDAVWGVEGRGVKERVVGLGWLAGAGIVLAASIAATAAIGFLPGWAAPLALVVALVVNGVLFLWTDWLLPNRRVPWRACIPGAVVGAFGLTLLQVLGAVLVPHLVANASALWGSLGAVFAILAWLALFSRLALYAAITDVVVWEEHAGTRPVTRPAPRLPRETSGAPAGPRTQVTAGTRT